MIPEWFSDWVICETDNWHLKPEAPKEIVEAFSRWMKEHEGTEELIVD